MNNTGAVSNKRVLRLTYLSVLTALMAIMAFTPLGYLKTAGLEISFMMIPVVIGAIVMGPKAGAFLGGVFGLTSFIQCFGYSSFGVILMSISPIMTFLTCMVPRVLAGLIAGFVFKWLNEHDKTKLLSISAASLSGAVLNTIFFMTFFIGLFGRTEFVQDLMGDKNVFVFAAAFVGINAVAEAIACTIAGTAISKVLLLTVKNKQASA